MLTFSYSFAQIFPPYKYTSISRYHTLNSTIHSQLTHRPFARRFCSPCDVHAEAGSSTATLVPSPFLRYSWQCKNLLLFWLLSPSSFRVVGSCCILRRRRARQFIGRRAPHIRRSFTNFFFKRGLYMGVWEIYRKPEDLVLQWCFGV